MARPRRGLLAICAAALLCGLLAAALLVPRAGAVGAGSLEAKLASARDEAGAVAAGLRTSRERLASAEAEAATALKRERRLSSLLAEGREHAAELGRRLRVTRRRLAVERSRLRRSRRVLARRLVAIYESGAPSTASLVLGSSSYQALITQSGYLREIEESDTALAARVEQVRDEVRGEARAVAALEAEAIAYDERLAAARTHIQAVRQAAEAASARQESIEAEREAALASLKADIADWVKEIQAARAASAAEAEEEVGRWLGGPYSIPVYIVMCESGGDYGAVNPSSGAGGAYQILPSTWELYGGTGAPQEASKAEQDRIAGEIWADSGPSAWVCG